jgi:hypothetical protein
VDSSLESSESSVESSAEEFSEPSAPGLRRPRPPRRRRRLRPPRESASSESAESFPADEVLTFSSVSLTDSDFFALFLVAALGAFSSGAAWKIGTGIEGAFFFDLVSVASTASVVSTLASTSADFFLLAFFTARLRGDFGSIAMAPNPSLKNMFKPCLKTLLKNFV